MVKGIMSDFSKIFNSGLAKVLNGDIFFTIGCGSPVQTAGGVTVNGDNSLYKTFPDSWVYSESVGCILCSVTVCTSSTPAGSFFVPDVEVREKGRKNIQTGALSMHAFSVRNVHESARSISVCGGLE